jgi:hypothetical protein
MKRCAPGVICIESVTSLFFIVIIVVIIGCFIYVSYAKSQGQQGQEQGQGQQVFGQQLEPNYPYNNLYNNSYNNLYNGVRNNMTDNTPINGVLTNPYDAPYKDERYFVPKQGHSIPINVSTNIGAVDTSYRQMGIITPLNGNTTNNILPLMGRPLYTSRQKWQYYTISNQHNNVKLPISVKGRSALNDYGVDELYNGDTVYVEGYNDAFKVTVYENSTIKYLPVL